MFVLKTNGIMSECQLWKLTVSQQVAGDADGSQSTMVLAKADFLGSKKILFLNSGINKKIKQLIFHHLLLLDLFFAFNSQELPKFYTERHWDRENILALAVNYSRLSAFKRNQNLSLSQKSITTCFVRNWWKMITIGVRTGMADWNFSRHWIVTHI